MRYNEVADHIANSNGPALTGLAARDSRITILTQPNLGTVAALHAGLRLCQAEFVAIQDADGGGARLSKKSYGLYGSVRRREHIGAQGRFLGTIQTFPQPHRADLRGRRRESPT